MISIYLFVHPQTASEIGALASLFTGGRHVKKGGELMDIDIVLIDPKFHGYKKGLQRQCLNPDDAKPHSKEKINELSRMAPSRKVEFFSISLTCMDEVENGMEHEIHSGDGAHNKAVAKPFGKPCSKSKYNSKHCKLINLIVIVSHLSQSTEFDCSLYQQADRDSN
ncbi:hypothetical protein DY000_02020523 [Brassica cretica]|uniref:Uncharacterized protein n=1 Tax=Brassica cretica TaxID=69181 RepID=A0ABQ7E3H3_BRACR|nr:hypothetical protein DY000_02020523 [Brassica cretica]